MKKLLALFSAVLFTATFSVAQSIKFEKLEVDYGTIQKAGEPVREFKFTNNGTAPLIITDAKGSCGCTVPSFPKEPIMPGASNVIKVRYDTNRVGVFTKYVTLTTNDPSQAEVRLKIFGEVKDQPAAVPQPEKGFNN